MADPQTDLLEYAAAVPDQPGVSRAASLLGSAGQGFGGSVLAPLAAAARLTGQPEAAQVLSDELAREQGPGGLLPTNPEYANDFSTGVARAIGAAPVTALTAEAGLPALVGTGALSGYQAYQEKLADYNARAAAGQLGPGEEPPSPYAAIGKGALGNAAFLLGGGAAGIGAKAILPSIEGPAARLLTAYGATAAGNLAGSAIARKAETGKFGYATPAEAGEDIFTGLGTFGVRPTQHLLADRAAAYRPTPPPLPVHPVDAFPQLALNPISEGLARATTLPPTEPLAPSGKPAEAIPALPAPTTQPNETRQDVEQIGQVGPSDGTNGPVNPAEQPEGGLRPVGELGPGTQEIPVRQPNEVAAGGNAQDTQPEVRGEGELGPGAAQRPVLTEAQQDALTAPTTPESPATLAAQQAQLIAGQRPAMLFTQGETELPLPPNMARVVTPTGVYHFNPLELNARDIVKADKDGRQNQILGLGPENKADVVAAPGTPVVVTERTPEGTEVKAAAASEGQAPATAEELQAQATPGNTVQVEDMDQALSARRNAATIDTLHQDIGALDQEIAQARARGFDAEGNRMPGEEAAAARDQLPQLQAQRQDKADELLNFTPESTAPVEPQSPAMQEHTQKARDLQSLLDAARAKFKAASVIVANLWPEGGRILEDENGNRIESTEGLSKDELAQLAEARADQADARRAVQFLQQKLGEHAQSEPEAIEAPQPVSRPTDINRQGFYSTLARWADKLPDELKEIAGKTIPGREIKAKEIRNPKTGELIKSIPAGKEPDKVYPTTSVVDQFQKLAAAAKVPPDELKWSGIIPWLKEQGPTVSKKAIQDYIKENGSVKVDEVYFGKRPVKTPEEMAKETARQEQVQRAVKGMEAAQQAIEEYKPTHRQASADYDQAVADMGGAGKTPETEKSYREAKEAVEKTQAEFNKRVADRELAQKVVHRAENGLPERTPAEIQAYEKAHAELQKRYQDGELTLSDRNIEQDDLIDKLNGPPELGRLIDDRNAKAAAVKKAYEARRKLSDAIEGKATPTQEKLLANLISRHEKATDEYSDAIQAVTAFKQQARLKPEERAAIYQRHMHPFAPVDTYHEIVLTKAAPGEPKLPNATVLAAQQNDYRKVLHDKYGDGFRNKATREENAHLDDLIRQLDRRMAADEARKNKFQAPHFSGAGDVISNVLVDRRTDAAGDKVSLVQEFQSDRHGRGAREGYQDPVAQKQAADIKTRMDQLERRLGAIIRKAKDVNIVPGRLHNEIVEELYKKDPEYHALHDELFALEEKAKTIGKTGDIPDAPFRTDHALQGFKRVLRDAVLAGDDAVGWNKGDTVNERYSLERALKSIQWERASSRVIGEVRGHPVTSIPNEGVIFKINLKTKEGGDIGLEVAKDGTITAGHIRGNDLAGSKLSDLIGEEHTKTILESQPHPTLEEARANLQKAHDEQARLLNKVHDTQEQHVDPETEDLITRAKPGQEAEHEAAFKAWMEAGDRNNAARSALNKIERERAEHTKVMEAAAKERDDLQQKVEALNEQLDRGDRRARGMTTAQLAEHVASRMPIHDQIRDLTVALKAAEEKATMAVRKAQGLNEISGEGLKVGGTGKRRLYDQKLPQDIGDYVGQWGGKVEDGVMPVDPRRAADERARAGQEQWRITSPDPNGSASNQIYSSRSNARTAMRVAFGTSAEQQGFGVERLPDYVPQPVDSRPYHKVRITDEMRRAVQEEGQPIAAADPKAVEGFAKDYNADPAKMQAFDEQARAQAIPKFGDVAQGIFGAPIESVHDSPLTDGIGVVPTRAGGVQLHIGQNYFAKLAAKFGDKAHAFLAKALEEEGIHVAVLKAIHDLWSKEDPNSRPDFYEYSRGIMGKISGEILDQVRALRDQGKHSEAFAIEEAVRNAKEIYDGQLDGGNSMSGRQILEQMQRDPKFAFRYVNEMLRQFAQLKANKQISENVFQRITNHLRQLYAMAQQSLRKVVGTAYEGGLGETAKGILRRVDELVAEKPAEGPEVKPPPLPENPQKISHLEERVIPWHGGADDQDARTISRNTRGNSPAKAASDYLAAGAPAGEDSLRPDQRNVVDLARLAQFESGRGRLIDGPALFGDGSAWEGGGEHRVSFDPATQRWLKVTRPSQSGLFTEKFKTDFPLPDDISKIASRNATPQEYLDRIRLANEKFGDDIQYHGVVLGQDGEPSGILTSQPNIEGVDAQQKDVTRSLTADGFKRVGPETWYRPSDRLMLDDAHPKNFRLVQSEKTGEQVAQPIDVPLRAADDELHDEAMKQIGSGKKFLKPTERALPFPPQPDNRQIIEAPRFIEKAAKTVAEKTKEYRYLWGKNYRGFKDSLFRAVDVIDTTGNNEGAKVTNSIYNIFSQAGGGRIKGINEASKELERSAELAFPLREAGFADATTPEEILAAHDKLQDFRRRIELALQSNDPDVVRAAEKLKPIYDDAYNLIHSGTDGLARGLTMATKIGQETARQLADANSAGVDIEGVDDYIRRVYEDNLNQQDAQYVPSAGGKGGLGYDKGFVKPRAYETAVDAMEAGKTLANANTAQLVGQGESSLQKLIGEKKLYDELRTVNAPVTNVPVITKPLRAWNPRLKSFVEHAPDGYVKVDGPGGKPIYVEQNVAPLFRTLAATSWVRSTSPGRSLLRIAAGIKHGTLLFDSYHLARQTANLLGLLGQNASIDEIQRFIKKGLATLDLRPEELDDFIRHGVITEADKAYVLRNQEQYKLATAAGVNFGKQLDNLYEQVGKPFWVSILNQIPKPGGGGLGDYITDFNKYVFQKSARAAMLVGFNEAFERNQARFPNLPREQVARQTAKEINEIFGNMGRQGIFKSKTAQDISRLFVLAPQWNDARLRFQGRALGQTARALGKLAIGKPEALGNASGVLLALAGGAFAANQITNLLTTGQPTWNNPDGHKLDAFIPGGKNGFYYSPLNLAAEDLHTIMRYGATQSPLDTAKRIALNKASGLGRAGAALAGIGPTGRPLPTDVSRVSQAAKSLLPIPIFASPLTSPILQPELAQKGDMERQALGMAGIKLDRAESPEQRLRTIANQTLPQQFPKAESPGDYSQLRNFVANEKVDDAKNEILRLVSKGKTEDQIREALRPERPYTVSRQADALLMRNPQARALLAPAHASRVSDFQTLQQAIGAAKQDPKYQEAVIAGRKTKQPVQ